jgi:DNA-binding response OmpR family regulator
MPETRAVPVVVLSHEAEEVDRIVALELGASDYVTRPYSVRELVLRIRAILRRARPEPRASSNIDVGRLRIDRAAYRVWIDGAEVQLTLLELNLLIALHEGGGRVQTRAALLEEVWGLGANVTTRTVDTHVKRLRDKLGPPRHLLDVAIAQRIGKYLDLKLTIENLLQAPYRVTFGPKNQDERVVEERQPGTTFNLSATVTN